MFGAVLPKLELEGQLRRVRAIVAFSLSAVGAEFRRRVAQWCATAPCRWRSTGHTGDSHARPSDARHTRHSRAGVTHHGGSGADDTGPSGSQPGDTMIAQPQRIGEAAS